MVSTSLENLLMTRPSGVVSKNFMGCLRMFSSKASWRRREATTIRREMLPTKARADTAERERVIERE